MWSLLPLLFGYDPEGGESLADDYTYRASPAAHAHARMYMYMLFRLIPSTELILG